MYGQYYEGRDEVDHGRIGDTVPTWPKRIRVNGQECLRKDDDDGGGLLEECQTQLRLQSDLLHPHNIRT